MKDLVLGFIILPVAPVSTRTHVDHRLDVLSQRPRRSWVNLNRRGGSEDARLPYGVKYGQNKASDSNRRSEEPVLAQRTEDQFDAFYSATLEVF